MIFVFLLLFCVRFSQCSLQGDEVSKWAENIGDRLWDLGREITKSSEIEQNYGYLNARVEDKEPRKLLEEIKGNILRMMDRKMDAIRCIQQKAEDVAENYTWDGSYSSYYSSKWSFYAVEDTFYNVSLPKVLNYSDNILRRYRPMYLNNDTHFYNIPVNTSYSSVHVPTNVYDRESDVAEVLQWSEALDEVFAQNYKSDPALSWQYFGSSTGIMRHYPAMHWSSKKKEIQTLFDCRIRTWYIEAATCTKDVVILFDNSGSMDAMGKHIATLTAFSILDTFSNNDYVNILNYSDTTSYLVPCFAGELVQATEENILIFKEAIKTLKPDGKTGVEQALETAFKLLQEYRVRRNCNDADNQNCNQAIMILTDGVNSNLSDLVTRYNWLENGTNIPVRIFTYLIGGEVTNGEEARWLSCNNRGYYSYVPNLEQVTASVMEYINVIARPMVLQEEEHPVSWTHAYADVTYDDATDNTINEPYRLLTSAAIPLFDKKINKMNDTRTALLLGVAATDVPIDEFRKLTKPYKIGVNGYAFIVSNNGYVLMHPDLRPVFKNMLKENYNSIDFTEVEQIDEDLPPRNISDNIILHDLRYALVNGESGEKLNVKIKYHYDSYKRVAEETYDYYYTPLEDKPLNINTPFSLAIAIPHSYGKYEITPSMDQIKKYQFSEEDLRTYLTGTNWRIHPNWVYCRYHYLEGHEYSTPEDELLHFLGDIYNTTFKWQRQYEPMANETISDIECGRKTLGDDDYYCDRQLLQRLIFDATNTYSSFGESHRIDNVETLFHEFDVSLRFVATMSGLTRWDDFSDIRKKKKEERLNNEVPSVKAKTTTTTEQSSDGETTVETVTEEGFGAETTFESVTEDKTETKANPPVKKEKIKKFGDVPLRAIDEKWYKSAVLQHSHDTESFVYSVPFEYENSSLVTGSFAIFVKESGKEAPGCVVGYQFSHAKFEEQVKKITDKLSNQCSHCMKCGEALDCYIVDSSGYILYSSIDSKETGQFFGEKQGDIMDSMLSESIFETKVLYDYQAYCSKADEMTAASPSLKTPFESAGPLVKWFFQTIIYLISQINVYNLFDPILALAQEIITVPMDFADEVNLTETQKLELLERKLWEKISKFKNNVEEPLPGSEDTESSDRQIHDEYFACDTKVNLVILRQSKFINDSYPGEVKQPGKRTFYVKRVPHSNLIFVAIESKGPKHTEKIYTTEPQKLSRMPIFKVNLMNDTILPCRKLYLNNLERRRLTGCFNEHPLESEIMECGRASPLTKTLFVPLYLLTFILLIILQI